MKKFLKWTGIVLLILFLILLIAPFLFKDKIISKIKEETNKNLNAKVDFGGFDLSLLRSFPNLSLKLENLSVINMEPFAGDTLVFTKELGLTIDIMSVIRGDQINIRRVYLNSPVMNFLVTKEGKTNWDIAKPSPAGAPAEKSSAFKASLKYYSISNGRIIYDDKSLGFYLKLNDLNHSGSGDFTQDLFVLSTKTEIASTDLDYGGVRYINHGKTKIDADLNMDMKNFKFTFKDNKIALNALNLGVDGWLAMPDTNIDMDIKFSASQSDFKNFISMIPAVYAKDFNDVKASGTMALAGFVKGRYNGASMPGFGMNLKIDHGMFKYPSLPSAVENTNIDLAIQNPDGVPDHTVINLKQLHTEIGGDVFDAKLYLKTPVSDPDLDASMKGRVDLSKLSKIVPLEKGTELQGLITADLTAKGQMSAMKSKNFDHFDAAGTLSVNNMKYVSAAMPQAVELHTMQLEFNPSVVELKAFSAQVGKSDFSASGSLENFIAYAIKNEMMKGNLKLNSNVIDLNEFMTGSETAGTPDTAKLSIINVPENINFRLSASIGKLLYENVDIRNVKGDIIVADHAIRMSDVVMSLLDGGMKMNGAYSTVHPEKPTIAFQLDFNELDIQKTAVTFNSVQKMAPIVKNCKGKYSGSMSLAGDLAKDMSPVLPSLNGFGKLSTSNITVDNFPAFSKIADALKMPSWKQVNVAPMNPSFKFTDGRVVLDPVTVNVNTYKTTIAGSNGFDQTIDYTMASDIPRAAFGSAANSVLNNLVNQANSKGANLSIGETVPVKLKIIGTVTDPKVSTDLNKEGAKAMDELKAKAKEEFDKKKAEAEAKLKAEAQARMDAEADKLKKEGASRAKAIADSLKNAAAKQAKDKLKGFNPFKK